MMQPATPRLPAASPSGPTHELALPLDMIPIIYHPKYNITVFGLERLHPFDGLKYRRIHDALIADGLTQGRPTSSRPGADSARRS